MGEAWRLHFPKQVPAAQTTSQTRQRSLLTVKVKIAMATLPLLALPNAFSLWCFFQSPQGRTTTTLHLVVTLLSIAMTTRHPPSWWDTPSRGDASMGNRRELLLQLLGWLFLKREPLGGRCHEHTCQCNWATPWLTTVPSQIGSALAVTRKETLYTNRTCLNWIYKWKDLGGGCHLRFPPLSYDFENSEEDATENRHSCPRFLPRKQQDQILKMGLACFDPQNLYM